MIDRATRNRILERAGHKCDACKVDRHAVVNYPDGRWCAVGGNLYLDLMYYAEDIKEAREGRDCCNEDLEPGEPPFVVIVLTVIRFGELEEENGPDDNLHALCQRCLAKLKGKAYGPSGLKAKD